MSPLATTSVAYNGSWCERWAAGVRPSNSTRRRAARRSTAASSRRTEARYSGPRVLCRGVPAYTPAAASSARTPADVGGLVVTATRRVVQGGRQRNVERRLHPLP